MEMSLDAIASELNKLNTNISYLTDMLERKFGGDDESNLNVTLYTDTPIAIYHKRPEPVFDYQPEEKGEE